MCTGEAYQFTALQRRHLVIIKLILSKTERQTTLIIPFGGSRREMCSNIYIDISSNKLQ